MKKNMNRYMAKGILSALLTAIVLAAALMCVACADKTNNTGTGAKEKEETGETPDAKAPAKGYTFTYNGVTAGMDMEAAPLLDALSIKPVDYYEAASCAFDGLDKIYSFGSFEIHTYPVDDKDYIQMIVLRDDMVGTNEGISIGAAKDDVISAYGNGKENESLGMLEYAKDGMTLAFVIKDNHVVSIEYRSGVLDN